MDRVLCVIFCVVVIAVAICVLTRCAESVTEPPNVVNTEDNTPETPKPTEEEEPIEEVIETLEAEPPLILYDVPLSEELQLHIIIEAEEHGIDPAIIFAMAYKESTYRSDAIGDNGNSFGLLQVQPRWHSARMARLGCTNLLDPYQNVVVGIDFLCELLNRYGSIDKALTAYNQGHYNGTVTQYAKTVLAYAEQINNERSQ